MEVGGATHPPDEMLMERYVRYIDELSEVIEERGWPSLDTVMAAALAGVPQHETQAVIYRERLRYGTEVAAPAEAILRERKASRPAAVAKVPVAFTGGGPGDYDPAFYAQALDGVEPRFLRVAEPPETTRLALRVSWPRESAMDFPRGASAFVSGADRDVLALYVGKYRPCLGIPGFYLVLDASANSAAVVPQLPRRSFSVFSGYGTIGTGVAVLRHGGGEYLLAELLRRAHRGRISCKGTLLRWWSSSSGSGPAAGRWVPTEVTLPLPGGNEQGHHSFCADVAFAVGGASLCWADLLQGIVMCDGVLAIAGDDPQFRFIPLPPGTSVAPGIADRFPLAARRSMCCVERDGDQVLKFVAMDGCYGRDLTITVWTLRLAVNVPTAAAAAEWERSFSCSYGELRPADPAQQLELLVPTYHPVLSLVDDHVVYFTAAVKLASKPERLEDCVGYLLRVDMRQRKVLSSSMLPPGSGLIPTKLVVSTFSSYLHKRSLLNEGQTSEEEIRIKSEKHVVGLASLLGDLGCTDEHGSKPSQ